MNKYDAVKTDFFTFGSASDPFTFHSGEKLSELTIAYETYGELSAEKDNAVLVFHALSASQHAAGYNASVPGVEDLWTEECHTGWWDGTIGPDKGIDTNRYYVICANYIGGCYGSTGPRSINPETKQPYADLFPRVAIWDIIETQIRLLDYLGIRQLHAVVGSSIGGMLALGLSTRHPDRVRNVIPIASGMNVSVLQRILNLEQIYAIENDPNFHKGNYYGKTKPTDGLALARMISHKTFISLSMLEGRARDEVVQRKEYFARYDISHPVESYMLHQGRKFIERFDANTYLRIIDAWQHFDLLQGTDKDDLRKLFSRCKEQKYLVFSIDSDVCFYPEEQAQLVETLKRAGVAVRYITVHSEKGHDSFLLEPELYAPYLSYTLDERRGK